jgi:hypothetical protein
MAILLLQADGEIESHRGHGLAIEEAQGYPLAHGTMLI